MYRKRFERLRNSQDAAQQKEYANIEVELEKKNKEVHAQLISLESLLLEFQEKNKAYEKKLQEIEEEKQEMKSALLNEQNLFEKAGQNHQYSNKIIQLAIELLNENLSTNQCHLVSKAFLRFFGLEESVAPSRSFFQRVSQTILPYLADFHLALQLSSVTHYHINEDGTTLNQHKLIASALNGLILGVDEISDGSSGTVSSALLEKVKYLDQLREKVSLDGEITPAKFASMMSDGHSVEDACKKEYVGAKLKALFSEQELEHMSEEQKRNAGHFISMKCLLHMDVNVCEKGVEALDIACQLQSDGINKGVSGFIRGATKLLGPHGAPEYGLGVNYREENVDSVALKKGVGNRFNVLGYNATIIVREYIEMLEFVLDNLERQEDANELVSSFASRLGRVEEIAATKGIALFYLHLHHDFMTLVKSSQLQKRFSDFPRYVKQYCAALVQIAENPFLLWREFRPFDELKLYSTEEPQLNHRVASRMGPIFSSLLKKEVWDDTTENFVKIYAVAALKELKQYYPELLGDDFPDFPNVSASNCVMESCLGLNDYLRRCNRGRAHQSTISAKVMMKKNKTLQYLDTITPELKDKVITVARTSTEETHKRLREQESKVVEKKIARRTLNLEESRRKAERRKDSTAELNQVDWILTVDELNSKLDNIFILGRAPSVVDRMAVDIMFAQVKKRKHLATYPFRPKLPTRGNKKAAEMKQCLISVFETELENRWKPDDRQQKRSGYNKVISEMNLEHLTGSAGNLVMQRKQKIKESEQNADVKAKGKAATALRYEEEHRRRAFLNLPRPQLGKPTKQKKVKVNAAPVGRGRER
eukprot:GCRY01005684.1.p1 GENE.GCRY01005684.1~~GCRY01005684.1.p1  ORF type:complete len:822 (+),score=111.24 GCRY01005684.1:1042-3507(+)